MYLQCFLSWGVWKILDVISFLSGAIGIWDLILFLYILFSNFLTFQKKNRESSLLKNYFMLE